MGRNAVKNRVLAFCGLCFFPALEKNRVHEKWGLCLFTQHFPPMSGTLFLFRAENFWTPLSVTSYILHTGARVWDMASWHVTHYNMYQTKRFKDFAPKKSNLFHSGENSLTP